MKPSLLRLRGAARTALQWRLLLLWAAWLLVPSALLMLPAWQLLSANLDHSVHGPALARALDLLAITDLMSAATKAHAVLSNAGIAALLLTLLLSPLLSGMAISAGRAEGVLGFRALTAGALHEYPRLLRMLLWAVVPLGAALALGAGADALADRQAETAIVESRVDLLHLLAGGLTALLLVLAHVSLEAGRAVLALDRRRTSAVRGWWDGCVMLVRRPAATLGGFLTLSVAGLALAALLGVARLNLPGGTTPALLGAFLLTQAIVAVVAWMRAARLFALMDLARTLAPQHAPLRGSTE